MGRGTQWLAVGTIEHHGLVSIAILATIIWSTITTRDWRSTILTIDSRDRHKSGLRRDRVEETLLVEADAILASAIG